MKLNPAKCTFGIPAGKLLGYIVSERGIEANPEKINAVMNLHKPASIKGVQRLLKNLSYFTSQPTIERSALWLLLNVWKPARSTLCKDQFITSVRFLLYQSNAILTGR